MDEPPSDRIARTDHTSLVAVPAGVACACPVVAGRRRSTHRPWGPASVGRTWCRAGRAEAVRQRDARTPARSRRGTGSRACGPAQSVDAELRRTPRATILSTVARAIVACMVRTDQLARRPPRSFALRTRQSRRLDDPGRERTPALRGHSRPRSAPPRQQRRADERPSGPARSSMSGGRQRTQQPSAPASSSAAVSMYARSIASRIRSHSGCTYRAVVAR